MSKLSNLPETVDICIKQGLTFSFAARFDSVDLSGQTVRLRIADEYGGTLLLELATGGSGIVISTDVNPNDTATVTLTEAQSESLDVGQHVYDFERVEGSTPIPICSGSFEVVGQA
jgi:hypothetical protein